MNVALIVVLTIVVLAVVIGLGLLIFKLMRRSQTVVPAEADRSSARKDRVVAVDGRGRDVTESEDAPSGPERDQSAFDKVLDESLEELHPEGGAEPPAGASG
jgi:hypothetical protein